VQPVLEKMCAENNDLQHLAKRSVVSYLRCVYLMKDKTVFKLDQIDVASLARSYGLVNAPKLEFVSKAEVRAKSSAAQDRVAMLKQKAKERKLQKQAA